MEAGSSANRLRPLAVFKLTSLVAFVVVAIALYFLERAEYSFFQAIERKQSALFAQAQADLVREQKAAARSGLLLQHEAGHVTLATLLSNSLWDSHFAPLVTAAQKLPLTECWALAERVSSTPPPQSLACYAGIGRQIMSLPRFGEVDSAVHRMMKSSAVFKIKVYDDRGLTVYSSELAQIGEDKAANLGWQSAAAGKPASELVHRDRFSAFEGVVEDRDLIQTYVPVRASSGQAGGVFEIYSDVTQVLRHIDSVSQKIENMAAANQARLDAAAAENGRTVDSNSDLHFRFLFAFLVALYLALFLLARNGQRIVDEQARAKEAAALREQLWYHEKMAALATMAANASHEIGNPLAIISGLAEDVVRAQGAGESLAGHAEQILAQSTRIAGMTRRITLFANARSEAPEPLDVNEMIRAVRDFLSFDARYRGTRFVAALADPLPACVGIPDHLNEVLMSLLQVHAEAGVQAAKSGASVVRIETGRRGNEVMIRIACEGTHPAPCIAMTDVRLDSARRHVGGMGGRLLATATASEIYLHCMVDDVNKLV